MIGRKNAQAIECVNKKTSAAIVVYVILLMNSLYAMEREADNIKPMECFIKEQPKRVSIIDLKFSQNPLFLECNSNLVASEVSDDCCQVETENIIFLNKDITTETHTLDQTQMEEHRLRSYDNGALIQLVDREIEDNNQILLENLSIEVLEYELVKRYFPSMVEIAKFNGRTRDYYEHVSKGIINKLNKDNLRIKRILDVIKPISENLFGLEETGLMISTLKSKPIVSTAEHHSFLTFHQQLNTSINQACLRSFLEQDVCVVFSCSTVKLDDNSLPRIISFKDDNIPILSNKYTKNIIIQAPSFNSGDLTKNILKNKDVMGDELVLENMKRWLSTNSGLFNKGDKLWEQISQFNYIFWKTIFDKRISFHIPSHYFMLPIEEIVRLALIEELQSNGKGWLLQVIFKHQLCQKLHATLDGADTCWDSKLNKGSFLFWEVSKGQRESLKLEISEQLNELKLSSKNISLNLDEKSIIKALNNKSIIPTAGFSIIYVSLYSGFDVLGGLFQVNYLPEIQNRLIRDFSDMLSLEELEIMKNVSTNLYVNFNQSQSAVLGGLYRIHSKITEEELLALYTENFTKSTKRSIDRLIAISRKY